MNKNRTFLFIFILCSGGLLIWALAKNKTQTPLESTLASAFQIAGKSTQSINQALLKVIPIDDLDEKDYFMTHPPLLLRISKFSTRANVWWRSHPNIKRYVGKLNLSKRECFCRKVYDSEWISLGSKI